MSRGRAQEQQAELKGFAGDEVRREPERREMEESERSKGGSATRESESVSALAATYNALGHARPSITWVIRM